MRQLLKRYERLESRGPDSGKETWLNWVIRLPNGDLAGYVQATVFLNGCSYVAYELGSRHWRQGIGGSAVSAMLEELRGHYEVRNYVAVLKAKNYRSEALLRSLGFVRASAQQEEQHRDELDEMVMVKEVTDGTDAA